MLLPDSEPTRAIRLVPGCSSGPGLSSKNMSSKTHQKMSFGTQHRFSQKIVNYMKICFDTVLERSMLASETTLPTKSDEQNIHNFFPKARAHFSELVLELTFLDLTIQKMGEKIFLDLKSRRSYPSAFRNTQALLLTPSELRERAAQRRVHFSAIFSILEPNDLV